MAAFVADVVLLLHLAFVLFVVAGLPLVWIGAAAGWPWVRCPAFRLAHLAAIGFVTLESLLGMVCPLTVWEDALRGVSRERSFVARWIHVLIYYDLPEYVFTLAYVAFAALVALTWWLVPPLRGRRRGGTQARG